MYIYPSMGSLFPTTDGIVELWQKKKQKTGVMTTSLWAVDFSAQRLRISHARVASVALSSIVATHSAETSTAKILRG